ncbi:hypothetical protein NFJ02_36g92410 [Pycnococcus provasolii]
MASSGSGPGLAGLGGGNGQPTGGSGALAPPSSSSVSSSNGLRLGAVGGKSTSTASPSAPGDNDGVVVVAVADTAHAAESTTDTTAPSSTSSKPTNATAVGVGEHRLTATTFGERLQRAISPITDYNASKVACSRQARSAKKATLLLVCAFVIFSLTFWQMHAVRAWWTRPCPSASSKPTNATAVGVGEHRLTTTTFGERLQRAMSPITDYNASKVACSRQARSAKKVTLLLVCAFVIFSLTFWQTTKAVSRKAFLLSG